MRLFKSACLVSAIMAIGLTACGGDSSSPSSATVVGVPPTPPPPPPPPPVSGERYVEKIFDDVDRLSDVRFGSGARSGEDQELLMDIYVPRGDSETDRPVMIFAFGGGFVAGFKRDVLISNLAIDFASRGYVTASIDYRLFEQDPVTEDEVNIGIIKAMHDMKAAIRFFRADAQGADTYGTREDKIFVGGVSAGGIMASFSGALDIDDDLSTDVLAFLNANNGTDGNSSDNTSISSETQGVFSISGAVTNFLWIDENSAPLYASHEEFDTTVPCRFATRSDGVPLAGGCDMVPRAQSFDVPAQLYLVEGSENHIGYTLGEYDEFLAQAAIFFKSQIDE